MTSKPKKAKKKSERRRPGRVGRLHASVEDELLALAGGKSGDTGRWNRPRKQKVSLYVDSEPLEWLKSGGPGYQTRINQILRRLMEEGKKREGKE